MGRHRPHERLDGEPWKTLGITKTAYYCQRRKEYENEVKRASGKIYVNSEERIKQIKEKYKNGVTAQIISELLF